jgi:hypothetical protein
MEYTSLDTSLDWKAYKIWYKKNHQLICEASRDTSDTSYSPSDASLCWNSAIYFRWILQNRKIFNINYPHLLNNLDELYSMDGIRYFEISRRKEECSSFLETLSPHYFTLVFDRDSNRLALYQTYGGVDRLFHLVFQDRKKWIDTFIKMLTTEDTNKYKEVFGIKEYNLPLERYELEDLEVYYSY